MAEKLLEVQENGGRRAGQERLPSAHEIAALAEGFLTVLFPEVGHAAATGDLTSALSGVLSALDAHLEEAVFAGIHRQCQEAGGDRCREHAQGITGRLMEALPDIRRLLLADVQAAIEADPAASGPDEIIACYPGLYAIAIYRVAHRLRKEGGEIIPRMLTEHAKSRTGIDIHPGATIGSSFFIDHGTGIVIGETTVIGNSVRIYQGVTLGALSIKRKAEGAPPAKRHPTIEDDVIIYANATILGGATVIGRGAVIGGNTFVTYSVPPGIRVGVG
ncbi:MAG TPA: serine acetyltransferase [Polyangia bacterium]|nr:serine acetyltransferase [Polyangia bacterium]